MPWSGAAGAQVFTRNTGVYTGTTAWAQTDAASRGIRSDDHDTHDQDIGTSLNLALKKDGGNSLSASIPAAGFGMTGMGVLGSVAEISVASASTADVLGAAALFVLITGTVSVTSLGTGTNRVKFVRFNGILTLTHNGTSLILPGAANITTAANDTMGVISDGSSNARVVWYQRAAGTSVAAALANTGQSGQIFGLTLSNNSTTAIDVAAGSARDSTDVDNLTLAAALTGKILGTAWAVGASAGMLDTGAVANAWYYIYLIKRVDTGVVDVLASTSATAPTMPSNYTLKRRIGAIQRTGGSVKLFKQVDDRFIWLVPAQDVLTANPGSSAVSSTLSIPVVRVDADIIVALFDITPAALSSVLITSPDQTDSTPNYPTNATFGIASAGATIQESVGGPVRVSTSTGAIRYRVEGSNADVSINIQTNGWWDARGRLG